MSVSNHCGARSFPSITSQPTVIKSPNYPSTFNGYTDCEYYIKKNPLYSAMSFVLYLTFSSNGYDLPGVMPNCDDNYLEIKIGNKIIGKFCGYQKPFDIYSYDGIIEMTLRSTTGSGKFQAYAYVKESAGNECSNLEASSSYLDSGIVHSPYYPLGYHAGDTCDVVIALPEGRTMIQLTLIDLHLLRSTSDESWDQQDHDYFQIRGSNDIYANFNQSTPIDELHENQWTNFDSIIHLTSTYKFLRVRFQAFHTTYSNYGDTQARGFYVGYVMTNTERPYAANNWWMVLVGILFFILLIVILLCLYKYLKQRKEQKTKIHHTENKETRNLPNDDLENSTSFRFEDTKSVLTLQTELHTSRRTIISKRHSREGEQLAITSLEDELEKRSSDDLSQIWEEISSCGISDIDKRKTKTDSNPKMPGSEPTKNLQQSENVSCQ